jgi:hypothetical protein
VQVDVVADDLDLRFHEAQGSRHELGPLPSHGTGRRAAADKFGSDEDVNFIDLASIEEAS